MALLAYLFIILTIAYVYSRQVLRHRDTVGKYKSQLEIYKKLAPDIGSVVAMSHFRETVDKKQKELFEALDKLNGAERQLAELKSQQQSKSVRLGLISENVLPFHSDFKYNVKDLVPMFRPIDYVVFSEDEIVFLEIKIGTSTLSEKQRNIKRLIEGGKVRFEEHRVTEVGYTVKETNGKETKS
jgi:predicted Holliday junction resolvase-like endonuclease